MHMGGRGHPRVKNRFHILRRKSLTCRDWKRSYLCNALSARRGAPSVILYTEQPLLSQRLDNDSVRTLCRFRKSVSRIDVEISERLRLGEISNRLVCDDPTPRITGGSFANRPAANTGLTRMRTRIAAAQSP